MPSPMGHAIAGIAAGWIIAGRTVDVSVSDAHPWKRVILFAAAGVAPDIDLLFGVHSGPTHGIGAAILAGLAWFAISRRIVLAAAVAAACASHILLDWLGTDTSPPIGIMALWPFSRDYYESSLHVFLAISRRYWLPEFWTYNFRALARELIILLPIAGAVVFLRSRRRASTQTM